MGNSTDGVFVYRYRPRGGHPRGDREGGSAIGRRRGPLRAQRGVRVASHVLRHEARARRREGKRQRRGDRAGAPAGRDWREMRRHAAARDEEKIGEERSCEHVHREWHGRRGGVRARGLRSY